MIKANQLLAATAIILVAMSASAQVKNQHHQHQYKYKYQYQYQYKYQYPCQEQNQCQIQDQGQVPEQSYNKYTGFYVAGNVGAIADRESVDLFSIHVTHASIGGYGLNGIVGYQFNPYLAPEVGVSYYRRYGEEVMVYDAALKGILPLGQRFNINGKLGAGLYSSHNESETVPYLGAGVGYAVTPNLDIDLNIQGSYIDFGIASAGLALVGGGITYHIS